MIYDFFSQLKFNKPIYLINFFNNCGLTKKEIKTLHLFKNINNHQQIINGALCYLSGFTVEEFIKLPENLDINEIEKEINNYHNRNYYHFNHKTGNYFSQKEYEKMPCYSFFQHDTINSAFSLGFDEEMIASFTNPIYNDAQMETLIYIIKDCNNNGKDYKDYINIFDPHIGNIEMRAMYNYMSSLNLTSSEVKYGVLPSKNNVSYAEQECCDLQIETILTAIKNSDKNGFELYNQYVYTDKNIDLFKKVKEGYERGFSFEDISSYNNPADSIEERELERIFDLLKNKYSKNIKINQLGFSELMNELNLSDEEKDELLLSTDNLNIDEICL